MSQENKTNLAVKNTKKVTLVTGASSGIGQEIAILLAKNGEKVIIAARREEKLKKIISENSSLSLEYFVCDFTKQADVKEFFAKLKKKNYEINKAYLNAGAFEDVKINNFSTAVYERMFQVNFFSVLYCVEEILPIMIKNKNGFIAITSSIAGLKNIPVSPAYSSAKAALYKFFEVNYAHLRKRNIKLQIINPGFVKTEILNNEYNKPFIIDAKKAALIIVKNQNKAILTFPWQMNIIANIIGAVPFNFLRLFNR